MKLQDRKQQNSNNKSLSTSNYFKYKGNKFPNQKTYNSLMDKKEDPKICCLYATHFRSKETYRLKVKG